MVSQRIPLHTLPTEIIIAFIYIAGMKSRFPSKNSKAMDTSELTDIEILNEVVVEDKDENKIRDLLS